MKAIDVIGGKLNGLVYSFLKGKLEGCYGYYAKNGIDIMMEDKFVEEETDYVHLLRNVF